MVQHGIFWLTDFPDHAISRKLQHIFPPGYEQWALEKRHLVEQEVQNEGASQISNLNCAAQASYNQLTIQVAAKTANIEQQLQHLATQQERLAKQQEEMFDLIKRCCNNMMEMKASMPSSGVAATATAVV